MQKLTRPSIFSAKPSIAIVSMDGGSGSCSLCTSTAALVQDMMNAATSLHRLHLKVTGLGSYAAHKALNEAYDAFPGHADDLAEEFQGAEETLLEYPNTAPTELNSVEEGLDFLRKMKDKVSTLQSDMPHTEIVNLLDNIKSTINSVKYKLLFLK
jgi:DNA-binding ferritin-like protein